MHGERLATGGEPDRGRGASGGEQVRPQAPHVAPAAMSRKLVHVEGHLGQMALASRKPVRECTSSSGLNQIDSLLVMKGRRTGKLGEQLQLIEI